MSNGKSEAEGKRGELDIEAPVYCGDCRSRNSWQRQPGKDIKGESGRILWLHYECKVCGATAMVPILTPT